MTTLGLWAEAHLGEDRQRVLAHDRATLAVVRLFEQLSEHPMMTLAVATDLLQASKMTANRAIQTLKQVGVLHEVTGKARDRIYAYRAYLYVLGEDTETQPE